ncbi:MAG TPA: DUF4908 domain-containing protein [Brevundimonas sp.]|jgi:hypothetical protein
MKLQRVEKASAPIPAMMAVVAPVASAQFVVIPAVAVLLATMVLAMPTAAEAAQVRSNAQAEQARGMGRGSPRSLPDTGRYVAETGETFIFDRSGSRPLFRFQSRTETWALTARPAPRGDIIYRNDAGDQILRVTPDGGMTLYSVRAPNGSPASMAGPAPALARPLLGPVQLSNLMIQRSFMMSRAMGRMISVMLDGEQDEALCTDALIVSTDAVMRMAASPSLRGQLSGLRAVTIREGRSSSVVYVNGELRVTVQPNQGATGRPSSARIIQAVRR